MDGMEHLLHKYFVCDKMYVIFDSGIFCGMMDKLSLEWENFLDREFGGKKDCRLIIISSENSYKQCEKYCQQSAWKDYEVVLSPKEFEMALAK
mmetsp:Transcript_10597/g.9165  ORF Transcript_10597/g.9165 Transcript_10597/m.9165 type:complete len:93 (-) Transcript_10597:57-335(-)